MRAHGYVPLTCMHAHMYYIYTSLSKSKKRKACEKEIYRLVVIGKFFQFAVAGDAQENAGLVRISVAVERHHGYGNSDQGDV